MNKLQMSTNMQSALDAVRGRQFIVGSIDPTGTFSISARPTTHPNRILADRESARLAGMYPGKAFIVMQLTGGSMVPAAPAIQAL
jgi:hypothetical protein